MDNILLDSQAVISEKALSRTIDGEAVILNLGNNRYYGLNETGTRIWHGLQAGRTPREIVAEAIDEYDASAVQIEKDYISVLSDLIEHNLVFLNASENTP